MPSEGHDMSISGGCHECRPQPISRPTPTAKARSPCSSRGPSRVPQSQCAAAVPSCSVRVGALVLNVFRRKDTIATIPPGYISCMAVSLDLDWGSIS